MIPAVTPLRSWLDLTVTRLGLFGLATIAAVYFGFIHFPVPAALNLVRHGGYYVILLTFALWLVAVWRQVGPDLLPKMGPGSRWYWVAAGLVAALALMAVMHETYRSKILYDEYVLQSTAYNLHHFRDNSAMVRGYDIQGVFLSVDSYVDKRPIFFPFLLSLIHDLTGYRVANVFGLNTGLFVLVLGLIGLIGWKLNEWRGGLLAIGLLGSLPLFAQNATGTGMELLNLCMLLIVILHGAAWLTNPEERTLSGLVLSVVLFMQSRYESALYVLPAGLIIFLGWWRLRRLMISWSVIVAPLLLIPLALQQMVVSNSPIMWELHENQTSRFSSEYLAGNIKGAFAFFTATNLTQANSLFLGPVGLLALILTGWRLWGNRARLHEIGPLQASLLLFGAAILAVTGLVMFYYWAALNDPMAARFALPLHVLLVLAIVATAGWGDRKWPVSTVALVGVGVFIFGVSAPKQAYHFYSHMGNDEIAWEQRMIAARPSGTRLIVTNKSTLPWLVNRVPSILLDRSRTVADRLADHLQLPDFSEILVTQGARPTTSAGDYQIPPDEILPEWFHLETVAERRFGTKLARISRLVSIDLPRDYKPSTSPAAKNEAGTAKRPQ